MFRKSLQVMWHALLRLRLPRGIRVGKGTFIRTPYSIPHGSGIQIGSDTSIHMGSTLVTIRKYAGREYAPEIRIGNNVYIGRFVFIAALEGVTIGDGCVLSDYVYINDAAHGLDPLAGSIMEQALTSKGPISIGRNCFVGYRAAVLPGVTLGDWCIVGVNAVVTRSFPSYCMLAGAPAKIVRTFNRNTKTWSHLS